MLAEQGLTTTKLMDRKLIKLSNKNTLVSCMRWKKLMCKSIIFKILHHSAKSPDIAFFFFDWDSLHARLNSHYDVVNIENDLEKKYVKTSLVPFGRDSLGE